MNTSVTFFHELLLCGVDSVKIFEIRNWVVILKNKSRNLSGQVIIVRLMNTTLAEFNGVLDYKLRYVICV